ncbi:hypothetical protein FA95DRAFT_925237 [Auriscalpium vulgare]|uniref:Uncharacterized protein n=1 Tax=Auriscalpium vulgare TaxID=40419 RepID=A0ACB8RZC0_9AGAM|nr:hypothetical protein FA95DRAFT_925237 [Auriscalpium vulgare]
MQINMPFADRKRTALEIKAAVESIADKLRPIGRCITKERVGRKEAALVMGLDEAVGGNPAPKVNEAVVEDLAKLYAEIPVHASGNLTDEFQLTVTRESDEENNLRMLFDGAAVSGFGDVRSQETKVDMGVRNAREISASEFTVSQTLTNSISKIWSNHFRSREVIGKPYKIYLYGKKGGFKAHLDTPETDIVGTFLVGIGDSTFERNLELGIREELDEADWYDAKSRTAHLSFSANPGQWVAFYPDVPHRVVEITSG